MIVPECLDHIVWICHDLERGVDEIAQRTGVQPVYGGVHAGGQTHNALVGLGGQRYLEILAPVRGPAASDDEWTRLAHAATTPRVLTYSLRSPRPLAELASVGTGKGWRNSTVASNGRTTPDGVQLRWQWFAPGVDPFSFAFPFFIDWLDSTHPSEMIRAAHPGRDLRLASFAVGHPDGAHLGRLLTELGTPVDTYAAPGGEFRVRLETLKGAVTL